MDLTLDFELRSEVDIKKHGLYVYNRHSSTQFLCGSYMINDDYPIVTMFTYQDVSGVIMEKYVNDPSVLFHAWNAQMEIEVWKNILTPQYGWPECPPLNRWRDTQAIAAQAGYPQDLGSTSKLVGEVTKLKEGKDLINFFCRPNRQGKFNDPSLNKYQWSLFLTYNKFDILSERSVYNKLKWIHTPMEQRVWEHVVMMNQRGLPIDEENLDVILEKISQDMEAMRVQVELLTNGEVTKPTQTERIKKYIARFGFAVNSLDAEAVEGLLDDPLNLLPPSVKKILTFRKLGGGSAIGKFKKVKELLLEDGTVKGNLRYYGAGPGRHSGAGVQPQNLPRYKHKDPELILKMFKEMDYDTLRLFFPVSKYAKGLIRPLIMAPDGYHLYVIDFSGIEARAIAWLCGEHDLIQMFIDGYDIYRVMASMMFGVSYDQISDVQRQAGKICILACGYAGGYMVFLKEAKKSKFSCTEFQAKQYVTAFRNSRPKVAGPQGAWKAFEKAAYLATQQPGDMIRVEGIKVLFQVIKGFLRMYLPSGRWIYYPEFSMAKATNRFGDEVIVPTAWWTNSTTHKWERRELTGPLLFQNCIQGMCRDLLTEAQLRLEDAGFPQICSVHDEPVGMVADIMGKTYEEMQYLTVQLPEWAEGFPIGAKGYIAKRYKKD